MATVAYSTLLPEVLPHVPDCPEPVAINAIRNAAIKFCNTTNWWQSDYGTVSITTAVLPYTFPSLAAGTLMAQIMSATIGSDGQPLAITNIDELDSKVLNWRSSTGQPLAIFQPISGNADFYPRPAGTDAYNIFMRIALAPTRASITLDSMLVESQLEIITAGALYRLLSMPNKTWSDDKLAEKNLATYESGIITASIDAGKSYGRQSRQIQMRSF